MIEITTTVKQDKQLNAKKNVLATLAYFHMFDYPLRKREIFLFLGQEGDFDDMETVLEKLVAETAIYKLGEFYSLSSDFSLSTRRRKGNAKATRMLQMAGRVAAFISRFPFVRGVAVSGSLSKSFAGDTADIDFFIITSANRLWIARTFLHLFKKVSFLLQMQHYFCMNYFVDEAAPEIIEKNIYTAIEVTTLLPLRGKSSFEKFFSANEWTKEFLPNNYTRISSAKQNRDNLLKTVVETFLSGRMGNTLDNFLMKLTAKNWAKKAKNLKKNSRGGLMGLKTAKHYAKPDPVNFQQKLLRFYQNSLAEIFNRYEYSLSANNELH
jgi:hypothetical protein